MRLRETLILFTASALIYSCGSGSEEKESSAMFTLLSSEETGFDFYNRVENEPEMNIFKYRNLYNGGGVAIGDVNNDGLADIYMTANMDANRLYINKGDFKFEEISESAGVQGNKPWSTGVIMVDVNADGWLDIYVSKAGSMDSDEGRRNLLFVNQKDGTFKEEAKQWGIDDPGYTTQVFQFDYDKDGDLDLYVLNYRYDFKNNTKISGDLQSQIETSFPRRYH